MKDNKNFDSLLKELKINECDEKSATKCFTCINEIKNLINESEDIKNE